MSKTLFSAAEIARMKLPGLPGSRENVQRRAERENWYSEERTGRGGVHKVYEVPQRYRQQSGEENATEGMRPQESKRILAGAIGPDGPLDAELMRAALNVADWVYEQNPGRYRLDMKGDLVLILYRYAVEQGWTGVLDDAQANRLKRLIA
ncbi:DNA-binding protein [Chitiniphilus eburneus]|uniref:DNA-binding protein n=1 Tax=Chitiniphilus eburneus TaxID=2571148 RepID=UPI0035D01597